MPQSLLQSRTTVIDARASNLAGNYTITATYLTHSNETSVNMTKNDQIELALDDLAVPEFTYCLILPLFVTLTLLTITFRRKETRGRHISACDGVTTNT